MFRLLYYAKGVEEMVNVHVHKAIYRKESKGTELSFLARTYVYIITSKNLLTVYRTLHQEGGDEPLTLLVFHRFSIHTSSVL